MMEAMKYLLVFLTALFFSGCQSSSQSLTLNLQPHQIYRGYPCQDSCGEFQYGYEQALANKLTQPSQCGTGASPSVVGCKAYLADIASEKNNSGLSL